MVNKRKLLGSLVGLGFLLSIASSTAIAQISHEIPDPSSEQTNQFRRIEQPLGLKVAVTLGGFGLIGLELWWFIFSKTKATKTEASQAIQEITK